MPSISVVIPLYNKGPYIGRAIQSILNQTMQNFEIIVVDGHSNDKGLETVRSFKDSRILSFEQNGSGVSSARNEGVNNSHSDFIAFLDADDEWMPNHLETLIRLRNMYPEAGACTTAYSIVGMNSEPKVANFHSIPSRPWEGLIPSYFKSAALGSPPVWTSAVGIPRKIFEEMGGFSTETWWGEDTDLWGRIALRYPIAFSWDGIGIYHTNALNRACNRREPVKENLFIFTATKSINVGDLSPEVLEDINEYVAKKRIETAWLNIRAKRTDLALAVLRDCNTKRLKKEKYWALLWAHMPYSIYKISCSVKNVKKIKKP